MATRKPPQRPNPLRRAARAIARRLNPPAPVPEAPLHYPFGAFMHQRHGLRPQYLWGTLCAATLARDLGYPRVSLIEFGVAGGNGLVDLEKCAALAERKVGIPVEVYGFDSGRGLPKPQDHRDLPNLWMEGDYRMDEGKLRARLSRAQLVLGPVSETVGRFLAGKHAPVGFVAFDLDLYSSTMDAFRLFQGSAAALLPRVTCYFDDMYGYSFADHNGERLAITDFNAANELRKISQIYGLRHLVNIDKLWTQLMYMFHYCDHPKYNDFDRTNPHLTRQLPLND